MNSRSEYFKDLIADCIHAVNELDIDEEHQGVVIAALHVLPKDPAVQRLQVLGYVV